MAEYNKKVSVSGIFMIVGKCFKAASETKNNGETKKYPDRFELYVMSGDYDESNNCFCSEPFIGTAKVTLKDYLSAIPFKFINGKGSIYGTKLTVLELDGMTVEKSTDGETSDERLARLIKEQGLNDLAIAKKAK